MIDWSYKYHGRRYMGKDTKPVYIMNELFSFPWNYDLLFRAADAMVIFKCGHWFGWGVDCASLLEEPQSTKEAMVSAYPTCVPC